MIVLTSIIAVAVFLCAFKLSGVYRVVLHTMTTVRKAKDVMRDGSLDDEDKELLVRQYSIQLFGRFVQITLLGALIVSLPLLAVLACDFMNVAAFRDVMDFLISWPAILATTVGILILGIITR